MVAVAGIATSCAWPPFVVPTVFVLLALFLPRSMLLAIVAWNFGCLLMLYMHAYAIAPVIVAAYTVHFGDIYASYVRFYWIATISGFFVISSLPTIVTLWFYDALVLRTSHWRRVVVSAVGWELLLLPVLVCSQVFNLHHKISRLRWAMVGPPHEIYSFTNLVLPHVVAWLICTVPVGVAVLWFYRRLGPDKGRRPGACDDGHLHCTLESLTPIRSHWRPVLRTKPIEVWLRSRVNKRAGVDPNGLESSWRTQHPDRLIRRTSGETSD